MQRAPKTDNLGFGMRPTIEDFQDQYSSTPWTTHADEQRPRWNFTRPLADIIAMQVCVRNHRCFNLVGGTSEAYHPQWKPRARAYKFCDSAKYEINAYPMALVGPIAASPYMGRRFEL